LLPDHVTEFFPQGGRSVKNKSFAWSVFIFSGALFLGSPAAWSAGGSEKEQTTPQAREGASSPSMESQMGSQGAQSGAHVETQAAAGDIKRVQEALKEKGHDPGPVDGILGPRTSEALKQFQQANGIEATGTLNAETKAKLGLDAQSRGAGERGMRQGAESGSAPERQSGQGAATQPSQQQGTQQ
jgi:peptidoglycan hydrolase-like protein with peptidoglycan-binding domain